MDNRGKQFELKVRKDLQKTFPHGFVYRLADQVSGYKTYSQNPCDVICFNSPRLFLLEIKTHAGASIPFDAIPQYDRLLKYKDIPNLYRGVILWLYDKDIGIVYIPISTIEKMKIDGLKSFGTKHLDSEAYKSYIIPSTKKVVFWDTDYSILMELEDGE